LNLLHGIEVGLWWGYAALFKL